MADFRPVTKPGDVIENVRRYGKFLQHDRELQKRIRRHPAWYACQDATQNWHFGPSKFVGYEDMTPEVYLDNTNELDGRITEPVLAEWFELVGEDTDLYAELRRAFDGFAKKFGSEANKRWRVSVPKSRNRPTERRDAQTGNLMDRVVSDPHICGGRPTIKGTRIRVSDLVEMVANGVTVAEIVADFPQLSADDIKAALQFAARFMDYAVVHAA